MRKICRFTTGLVALYLSFSSVQTAAGYFSEPQYKTPYQMSLVGEVYIDQSLAAAGSELRVEDPDGVVCGVAIIDANGTYNFTIYGDDETSIEDEGPIAGDQLFFTLYNAASGLEISHSDLLIHGAPQFGQIASSYPPLFTDNPFSAPEQYSATLEYSNIDTDGDGVFDPFDNCPLVFNDDQQDANGNDIGNACDIDSDSDSDGLTDAEEFECGSNPLDGSSRCNRGMPWLLLLLEDE